MFRRNPDALEIKLIQIVSWHTMEGRKVLYFQNGNAISFLFSREVHSVTEVHERAERIILPFNHPLGLSPAFVGSWLSAALLARVAPPGSRAMRRSVLQKPGRLRRSLRRRHSALASARSRDPRFP